MTAAGRCAAPGQDGGGCAAALSRKAAALWPGDAPREGTGPPLRRQACCASPAATALRTGPDPGDHCGPSGRKYGQEPACPAQGAARPVTTGPRAPADAGERSELAFDSHKGRKNYTNPLTVSVHASRGLPQRLWNELVSLRFLDGPHGALILGPVGVGKTHLATALGHIAVRRRRTVAMARADKLFKRLTAARLDNTLDYEYRRLTTVELLIIDDFALQPLTPAQTTDFYEVITERHRKASTVVTSNRDASEWLPLMTDPLLAQSAIDRLTSTCHELVVEGDSYRRRQRPAPPPVDDPAPAAP